MTPFRKAVRQLEKARALARKALRGADLLAQAAAKSFAPGRVLKLQNAIVEVKKHRATAAAGEIHLDRHGHAYGAEHASLVAEQLQLQADFVAEVTAAVARLEVLCAEARWNDIHRRAGDAIAKAGVALERTRAAAARASGLPIDTLARKFDEVTAELKRHLDDAKRCVALTITDGKRFATIEAEMLDTDRRSWSSSFRHPADHAVMGRALAAQTAAAEDLKEQLRDVNDAIETVKRRGNIELARQRLAKSGTTAQ